MSLRILFADDSVTAQNMGRKILTDAGYEVVAVSNGAAAVKKIAEQKPDIIILDVYMPGYTGLEVCEKVRGSVATLKTPVLLTVGKMEPYRAEETSRVRADGVIVKPFEASDLLAIVKKFEERIGQEPLAPEPQPVAVERFQESAPEDLAVEHPELIVRTTAPQATVDVPDHMATSSAFSDLLGTDSGHSMNNFIAPPPPVAREVAPPPPPIRTPIPEYDVPVSWRERIEDEAAPFSAAVPAPTTSEAAPPETGVRPPLQIPVYQEREETPVPAEVVPTATAPAGEIEIERDPELQETAALETRNTVADLRDPGLIATVHEDTPQPAAMETAATTEDISAAETTTPESVETPAPSFAEALASVPAAGSPVEEQVAPATEEPVAAVTSTEESATAVTEATANGGGEKAAKDATAESDFEARVAAAMSAYSASLEEPAAGRAVAAPSGPVQPASEIAAPPATMETAPAVNVYNAAPAISAPQTPAVPPLDYHPPAAYTVPAPVEIAPESTADSQPYAPDREPAPADHAVAESVEAAVPLVAAAAASASGEADHHTIAQAVHRVMERLKPELVEEILRELKSKE